jgi:hypothetical protein
MKSPLILAAGSMTALSLEIVSHTQQYGQTNLVI